MGSTLQSTAVEGCHFVATIEKVEIKMIAMNSEHELLLVHEADTLCKYFPLDGRITLVNALDMRHHRELYWSRYEKGGIALMSPLKRNPVLGTGSFGEKIRQAFTPHFREVILFPGSPVRLEHHFCIYEFLSSSWNAHTPGFRALCGKVPGSGPASGDNRRESQTRTGFWVLTKDVQICTCHDTKQLKFSDCVFNSQENDTDTMVFTDSSHDALYANFQAKFSFFWCRIWR